jgi:hypothetical protein
MTNEPTIHELFSLRGKVALITGGCGHLGLGDGAGAGETSAVQLFLVGRIDAC